MSIGYKICTSNCIFPRRAAAIVQAVTNYKDTKLIARLSEDLGEAMVVINPSEIKAIMEERGK